MSELEELPFPPVDDPIEPTARRELRNSIDRWAMDNSSRSRSYTRSVGKKQQQPPLEAMNESDISRVRYLDFLSQIHARFRPGVYLEIGVQHGKSLACALPGTRLIGIEPHPQPIDFDYELYEMTSDEFFASHSPAYDLAFIDGMHLFEFSLRDFIHLECLAGPESVVMFHDCLPLDPVATNRNRTTKRWVGDVWKLVPILREYRPDLDLIVVDVAPSGLGIVTGMRPDSRFGEAYEEIQARFFSLNYEDAARYDFGAVSPDDALRSLNDTRQTTSERLPLPGKTGLTGTP
jgi:hypothetical protein